MLELLEAARAGSGPGISPPPNTAYGASILISCNNHTPEP